MFPPWSKDARLPHFREVLGDCGKLIQLPRNSFEDKGQISCGCARRLGLIDNKRHPTDISNQRFGNLRAIALTGKKDKYNQPTWNLQCDCGNTCELSLKKLNHKQRQNLWINCGDASGGKLRTKHPENNCWYPPTPSPYPKEAGVLLTKYLPLTELNYRQIDTGVEDEKRDRLLRAAWILVYRRSLGEEISELPKQDIFASTYATAQLMFFGSVNLSNMVDFCILLRAVKHK